MVSSRNRGPVGCQHLSQSNMPIGMALPLYLSKEEFIYRTPLGTRKPALRFRHSSCTGQSELEDNRSRSKKQVTFADHKGLALTSVKVFSQFSDPIHVPLSVQQNPRPPAPEDHKLVLDFIQPSSDYLHFRQRLEQNHVCLEHCMLKEKALAGTVKVKNVSFQKSVKLRVTFDTWRSHTDVDCLYVKDTYPSPASDTFSFQVTLPEQLLPHEHIEFAVCYEVDGTEHWDSNQGRNYRVVWSSMGGSRRDSYSFRPGVHFDRYGSPTCSHGLFPDWPSYAGYENIGPYY
ncbi:protein phosphatase 1 regulatory subunit 3B [Betta splendens]|uniref:Protein phosphatase 1 regulatory subunit n=1 Tax=Betta splendens TaxID=158456 RepID=A0A6P7P6V6_BETSP|nr:protein phosphatase 1 regulatory subunit 3B [Betta splendens]